jgi:hypothetical protein
MSILINVALLFAINQWPTWHAAPFLTSSTPEVLGLVNASLIVGLVVNVVYLAVSSAPIWALGQLVILAVGLAATFRVWIVFPFDFGASSFDWALVIRILLVLGIVGSIIGMIVELVLLIRSLVGFGRPMQRT